MKRRFIVLLLLGLTTCNGPEVPQGPPGPPGPQGSTGAQGSPGQQGSDGSQGSTGPKGDTGNSGTNGVDGKPGISIVTSTLPASATQCPAGGYTIIIGQDTNFDGILDAGDLNIQSSTICNGLDGIDGANGTNGTNGADAPVVSFTPVTIIHPCSDYKSYSEIFLRLPDNTIVASFSDNTAGSNTRFSILSPGSYMTTDGNHCYFSVDSDGNLYNEHY